MAPGNKGIMEVKDNPAIVFSGDKKTGDSWQCTLITYSIFGKTLRNTR